MSVKFRLPVDIFDEYHTYLVIYSLGANRKIGIAFNYGLCLRYVAVSQ